MNINDPFYRSDMINKVISTVNNKQLKTSKDYTFHRFYENKPQPNHIENQLNYDPVLSYSTYFNKSKKNSEWLGFPNPTSYNNYNYDMARVQNRNTDISGLKVNVKDYRPYITKL